MWWWRRRWLPTRLLHLHRGVGSLDLWEIQETGGAADQHAAGPAQLGAHLHVQEEPECGDEGDGEWDWVYGGAVDVLVGDW